MTNSRLVYSSENGKAPPTKKTVPTRSGSGASSDGIVRVRREVKGRGGGCVIVISGVPLPADEIRELAGFLKKKCGTGGTAKGGVIEIQGDHRELLTQELSARGYKVKLSGG